MSLDHVHYGEFGISIGVSIGQTDVQVVLGKVFNAFHGLAFVPTSDYLGEILRKSDLSF